MIEEHTAASEQLAKAAEAQAASRAGKQTMQVKVYSPYKVYYDEESYSISGQNATGPFDILPKHHNFLTLLTPGELLVRPVSGKAEQKIRISGGLMHVKANKVTVFLDV